MTVKNAINAVRVMLGQDVPTEATTVEVQMAEAVLVDDTVVYTDGELVVGAVLKIKTEDGEDIAAPAAKHETKDGLIVTVAEGGVIESIEEKGEEPVSEDAEEEIKIEEKMEEDKDKKEEDLEIEVEVEEKDKDFNADELLAAIAEIIKEYQKEVSEVKEELSTLTERFQAVADMPAAKTVKKSYFAEAVAEKEVKAARFDRLSSLRQKSLTKNK